MRMAIDTGGTFTDCVFVRDGRLEVLKVFSTPSNPARAIGNALQELFRERSGSPTAVELLHGTTVGTNALLERRGARIALVTTEGFEDVLVIGRQARGDLYDLSYNRPPALVPDSRRLGVKERVGPRGEVLFRLETATVEQLVERLRRIQPEAVALSLLFSFANPAHEKGIARALRSNGVRVSVSHEILPEFREYERTATVVVNAYLTPVMGSYLSEIDRLVGQRSRVRVMQSNGGTASAAVAAAQPVRTVLSGPAGGVVGAGYVAGLVGCEKAISFDMGGTSTDVALLDTLHREEGLPATHEGTIGGLPLAVPMLDIHTVGAGGGSIAWFDEGGALRVGPQSAGADPGPVCYGKGSEPTVTDAHVVLGRLDPDRFLGGHWRLDEDRTRRRLKAVAARHRFKDVESFAAGILAVANATMERAIRVISVERGHDSREFTLVAFGGAGSLHACDLAEALQLPSVIVPVFPGALSALGILRSDVLKDYSRTVLLPADFSDLSSRLEREFRRLEDRARKELWAEGFPTSAQKLFRRLDLRYRGQGYELTVPYSTRFVSNFHRAHEFRYGYSDPKRAMEIVNLRLRALGVTTKPKLPRRKVSTRAPRPAWFRRKNVWFGGGMQATDFYRREELRPGMRFRGPAVVAEYSATTVVSPGWQARVDAYGNLLLVPSTRRNKRIRG